MLSARAERLARPIADPAARDDHLIVRAGRELVALPTGRLVSATRLPTISPVPGLASPWLGLVVVRARAHPAASLRLLLGGAPASTDPTGAGALVLVAAREPIGLVVDEVVGHRSLAPGQAAAGDPPLVMSTTPDLVHRLDVDALLDRLSGAHSSPLEEDNR